MLLEVKKVGNDIMTINFKTIPEQLKNINQQLQHISWSHPRTLLLLNILSSYTNAKTFLEIGTYMASVPRIYREIDKLLGKPTDIDFILIDNFEDHKNNEVCDPKSLKAFVNTEHDIDRVDVFTSLEKVCRQIDIVHFDSVKWQYQLIDQFDSLVKYFTEHTIYVFDDYIAEWPDVIHCVNHLKREHNLAVLASFGPKIYLIKRSQKDNILTQLNSDTLILDHNFFNIRETIEHGPIVSSASGLMIE